MSHPEPAPPLAEFALAPGTTAGIPAEIPARVTRPGGSGYSGTMSGAPSRAASAVRSSGWSWDSRSASTRFS